MAGMLSWVAHLPTVGKVLTVATAVTLSGVVGVAIVAPESEPTPS
jgi:hypothetical protein